MGMEVLALDRTSRWVSIGSLLLILAFLAAGTFLHPLFYIGAGVFGAVSLADIYFRFIQTEHTVARNFGAFGALRYVLESIGPELRQYWIASDTEERPFSRRERAEVYQYAKDEAVKSAAFGTQQKDIEDGTIRHSMFPLTPADIPPFSLTFGEERGCPNPFTITRPFMISALSFGSLGERAIRALSRGAARAGIPINTGEGGWPKYHLAEGSDVIFQTGTAKFGVRNPDSTLNEDKLRDLAAIPQIRMVEVKLSQGAKPGKGGLLPAAKVTPEIAELRGVPAGVDVLSPTRHVECDTVENTVAFIRRVQEVSGLPVGIKFCLGRPEEFESLAREMKSQDTFPDYVALDGAEGGTGAAPAAFLDHVGMPLFPALEAVTAILEAGRIRDRLKLVCSGKLIGPAAQIRAFAHGADAVYTARGFLFALGCIQALQCNTDHCPTGITTHRRSLQHGLDVEGKAVRVRQYAGNLEHTLYELLAATGHTSFKTLTPNDLFVPPHRLSAD